MQQQLLQFSVKEFLGKIQESAVYDGLCSTWSLWQQIAAAQARKAAADNLQDTPDQVLQYSSMLESFDIDIMIPMQTERDLKHH